MFVSRIPITLAANMEIKLIKPKIEEHKITQTHNTVKLTWKWWKPQYTTATAMNCYMDMKHKRDGRFSAKQLHN